VNQDQAIAKMVPPGQVRPGKWRKSKLTVVRWDDGSLNGERLVLVQCDCGITKRVSKRALLADKIKTCGGPGCKNSLRTSYHGMRNSPTYNVWHAMKSRCCNPSDKDWPGYGGRGIKICRRWLSFRNFLADMGHAPDPRLQIERINNNHGYCPSNCKWATRTDQANNRRSNVFLTFSGKRMTIAQWARKIGVRPTTLHERLKRGVSIEEALSIRLGKHSSNNPRKHND
jgi:hypothetical protein